MQQFVAAPATFALPADVVIRLYDNSERDNSGLARLEETCKQGPDELGRTLSGKYKASEIQTDAICVIAEIPSSNLIIGCARRFRMKVHFSGHILELFYASGLRVDPAYRRLGIAQLMFAKLANIEVRRSSQGHYYEPCQPIVQLPIDAISLHGLSGTHLINNTESQKFTASLQHLGLMQRTLGDIHGHSWPMDKDLTALWGLQSLPPLQLVHLQGADAVVSMTRGFVDMVPTDVENIALHPLSLGTFEACQDDIVASVSVWHSGAYGNWHTAAMKPTPQNSVCLYNIALSCTAATALSEKDHVSNPIHNPMLIRRLVAAVCAHLQRCGYDRVWCVVCACDSQTASDVSSVSDIVLQAVQRVWTQQHSVERLLCDDDGQRSRPWFYEPRTTGY